MDALLIKSKNSCPIDTSCENNNITSNDFDCCICYQVPFDPVLTPCGHLFCWPCLYTWLHSFSQSKQCPFCKSHIKERKLVPIFGKGRSQSPTTSEFINNIPKRPSVRRVRVSSRRTERNSGSDVMIPRLSILRTTSQFLAINGLIGIVMWRCSTLFWPFDAIVASSSSSIKTGAIGAKMIPEPEMFTHGYVVGCLVAAATATFWALGRRDFLAMLRWSRLLALLVMVDVITFVVLITSILFFSFNIGGVRHKQ